MGLPYSKNSGPFQNVRYSAVVEKEVNAELERQKHRFIPKGLDELQFTTAFNRKELQMLYRGFKEACPNGFVTAEKFDEILNYFFPYGETRQYAAFVFNTFDQDGNDEISFEEFATALSILSRGSSEEKLNWVFHLYDRSGKGYVNRDDMVLMMTAIYGLMGTACCPPVTEKHIVERADDAFKDKVVMSSLELFKTAYTKAEMLEICGLEDAADTAATTAAAQRQAFFQENLIKLSLPSDSPQGSPAKKKLLVGLATDTRESCV